MGGGQIVCVFPPFPGKKETHKQNSQEISGKGRESPGTVPGQSRDNFVYVFACLLAFFPCPINSGRNYGVVFTRGSFRKGVAVPIGVPGGGV